MNPVSVSFSFLLQIFVLLLLLACLFITTTCHGSESDYETHCLKSIKQSLDPFNQLSNWDFNTNSKDSNFCGFSGVQCFDMDEQRVVSSLNLSNMGLKGPFPKGIENCSSLQILDLSKNEISGEIPKVVANLYSLVNLKLDDNQLSGEIPREIGLLPQIESFNVANNFLSGEVPVFTRSTHVMLSYANNSGLCGYSVDLEPCDDDKSSDRSFWYSFAIAYVCSATSVIVSFMYYCQPWRVLLKKRRRNAVSSSRRKRQNIIQTRTTQVAELLPLALQEQGIKELSAMLERLISIINFGELCEATNYFSPDNVLGFGRTGIVYKAKLPNNNYFMAVKRLYDSQLYKTEFLLETMIPGKHRHHNIVPLVGFCLNKNERLLVYEYMPNGKLQDWLQSESDDGPHHQAMVLLEWPIRVYIALGLARGLSWLHNQCNIVHMNLSSECVLLSKDFEPKISNFGKAKFINQNMNDHLRKGSVEKDVYDFGVILLELITGKRLHDPTTDSSSLMKLISSCGFYNVIDKFLIGKGFDEKIFGLIEVACGCVKPCLAQRPKMVEVYRSIRALWEGYGPMSASARLKLSTVCPMEITCEHEIECLQ